MPGQFMIADDVTLQLIDQSLRFALRNSHAVSQVCGPSHSPIAAAWKREEQDEYFPRFDIECAWRYPVSINIMRLDRGHP